MDRLLITDVNGYLGSSLAATLADRIEVYGLGDQPPANVNCRMLGSPDEADMRSVVRDLAPEWIIECGQLARSSWDADDPASTGYKPDDLASLAQAAREAGCRLTVLSTDAVFTGPGLFHAENEPVREDNAWVRSVCAAEQIAVDAEAFVVRTHAYGWNCGGRIDGFAQGLWNALDSGKPVELSIDRHASPILADDLAELLLRAYRRDLRGLYHIAGGERSSPYRFGVELATACGFDSSAISPLWEETSAEHWTPRQETSLDCRCARRALGAAMPLLREGLARFARRQNSGLTATTTSRRGGSLLQRAA